MKSGLSILAVLASSVAVASSSNPQFLISDSSELVATPIQSLVTVNVATPDLPNSDDAVVSTAQTYTAGTTSVTSYTYTLTTNNVTTTDVGTYATAGDNSTITWVNYTTWVNYDGTSITSTW
jgi:hypothetical protein